MFGPGFVTSYLKSFLVWQSLHQLALLLYFYCLIGVCVRCLFLEVQWGGSVIVVFSGRTHLI